MRSVSLRSVCRGALHCLMIGALFVVASAGSCHRHRYTRDARVGTLYIGRGVDVTKKLGDADGQIYNQFQEISGAVAADQMRIFSVVDLNGITYIATKLVARDALGGGNLDRVQVWMEAIAGGTAELVFEEVASTSSNPALVVGNGDLYCVWVGGFRLTELRVFRSRQGTTWNDLGEITLTERLDGVDAGFSDNRLLVAGTSGSAIHVYEVRPQPLEALDRHTINTRAPEAENVSIATGSDWALLTYLQRGSRDLVPTGGYCNASRECRSFNCVNGICEGAVAQGQTPGVVYVKKLGLSGASEGSNDHLFSSPRIDDLKWASAARVREASDDPPPNDYFVVAFRGWSDNVDEIFFCKWTWPQGSYSQVDLTPDSCPELLELNDPNLQLGQNTFEVYADEYYRQRQD